VTPQGQDLDKISGNSDKIADITYEGFNNVSLYGKSAPWTGFGEPSYTDCVKQIDTQPYSSEEKNYLGYGSGITVCTITSAGNMAFVKSLGPASGQGIQAAVTLWSGR
jgi:hypothetical protein